MADLFEGITSKNKRKLIRLLEANTMLFKKDESILKYILNENIIGIIIDGYAQIVKTDYNGNRTLIEELYENNVFGSLISSLKNKEYDILTKEDTKILFIDYDNILNCTKNNALFYVQFLKNLLAIITSRIEEKNERIEILTKKSIRNKLLEYFSIVSKKHGSRYIYLPFNFTDLADYLAVDRSAMSRELKYLKEEGFIEVKGKRITLLYR
ncbi:MAG: Crp/Fnr family transcriptional regulator [Bacilli bacterium]|nr:Crp/Fnr family transcriptional regulator [Bacilli bacterium]